MKNNNLEQLKKIAWRRRNAETSKSLYRRQSENWFEKYAPPHLPGIDIGCGQDPINNMFRKYDKIYRDKNAQLMKDVDDDVYHTVYTSHILEHLHDPIIAIKNWYRICKPDGHIIIVVPHRDLYEKKKTLPSKFNSDHKTFWLPEKGEPPCTLGLRETILQSIPKANIVLLRTLDEGFVSNGPNVPSDGEISIEAIIHKRNVSKLFV